MPQPAPRVAGLLLAAGAGRRAGGPKALRRHPDGTSWLLTAVHTLLAGGCADVVVVLGAQADQARALLPAELLAAGRVVAVTATDWWTGLSRSLLTGLSALTGFSALDGLSAQDGQRAGTAAAVLVQLVDLPDVSAGVIRRVGATSSRGPDTLARASYDGVPGHPVLIGAAHVGLLQAELAGQRGRLADVGAQPYLARHRVLLVECGDLAHGQDQDGPEQER